MGYLYEKYQGQDSFVALPEFVDGEPLTAIGVKAFLSCKSVERMVVPPSVTEVGDWGFAHMKQLKEITLPAKRICFGKKVFLGCDNLKKISLSGIKDGNIYEGIPLFLASVFRLFPEESVARLDDLSFASDSEGQIEWLSIYDAELKSYIEKNDDYGFVPAFIGWFDVEDVDDQKDDFIRKSKEEKLFLILERLLYPAYLDEDNKGCLQRYLGEQSELLTDILIENREYGRNVSCYKLWNEAGALTAECVDRLLDALEDEPEIRAFLIKCKMVKRKMESGIAEGKYDEICGESFFEELEL